MELTIILLFGSFRWNTLMRSLALPLLQSLRDGQRQRITQTNCFILVPFHFKVFYCKKRINPTPEWLLWFTLLMLYVCIRHFVVWFTAEIVEHLFRHLQRACVCLLNFVMLFLSMIIQNIWIHCSIFPCSMWPANWADFKLQFIIIFLFFYQQTTKNNTKTHAIKEIKCIVANNPFNPVICSTSISSMWLFILLMLPATTLHAAFRIKCAKL